jgi:hypothetical protein
VPAREGGDVRRHERRDALGERAIVHRDLELADGMSLEDDPAPGRFQLAPDRERVIGACDPDSSVLDPACVQGGEHRLEHRAGCPTTVEDPVDGLERRSLVDRRQG